MATKKEQMVMNLINRRNYFLTLMGEKPVTYSEYEISSQVRKNSVADLESQMKSLEQSIKIAETKAAADKYWAEHQEEKQQLIDKKAEIGAGYKQVQERYLEQFNKLVESMNMHVTHMSTTTVEIASNVNPRYHFDIYYNANWGEDNREIEINYPCYGSFNPVKDREMSDYLMAMAVFAYNLRLQQEFKEALDQFNDEMEAIRKAVNEIDNYIKNPINL